MSDNTQATRIWGAGEWVLTVFTALYIISFTAYYLLVRNYEFLWYVAVLLFFFTLLIVTVRRTTFPLNLLWGLSIWGLLHMAGGGIPVGDSVLYAHVLFPFIDNGADFVLLKYDQLVHAFGFGVATLVVHYLFNQYIQPLHRGVLFYIVLAMAGTGLGVVNEIVEFMAVVALPETGVGGYYNTSLDLVFNTIGAAIATIYAYWMDKKKASTTACVIS